MDCTPKDLSVPSILARCPGCTMTHVYRNATQRTCVYCQAYNHIVNKHVKNMYSGMPITQMQYHTLLTSVDICPDLGVPFDDASALCAERRSIDRVDNSEGYTLDNVRVVSYAANMMRGCMHIQDWLHMVPLFREKMWRSWDMERIRARSLKDEDDEANTL